MANSLGPPVYENWRAFKAGRPRIASFEYPLFTDARVVGADLDFGSFMLFNTQAAEGSADEVRPALVLRYHLHIDMQLYSQQPGEKTDATLYHGGHVTDEVAALVSLVSAMRLKPGGESRRFEPNDAPGRPVAWDPRKDPQFLTVHGRRVIAPARGHFVANRDLLFKVPQL